MTLKIFKRRMRKRTMSNDIEEGTSKLKNDDVYELMRLRDTQSFIGKIYALVLLAFACIGIAIGVVLSKGIYRDVFMAETILTSVGVSSYIVLSVLMCTFRNHQEMKIMILLGITFFIGAISGFLTSLYLLDVSISLVRKSI